MSAAEKCDFKMESRPYGDGYTNFAGITCGWCRTELWLPAKDAGWAIRIFRANKWKVGNRPAQHRCPTCFGKARLGRKPVDNPAIPKEIGKVIKERIIATQAPGVTLTLATPAPQEAQEGPPAAEAPTIQASSQEPPTPSPEPPRTRRNVSVPNVSTYTRRDNAGRAAQTVLGTKAVDGVDFYALNIGPNAWVWRPHEEMSPGMIDSWVHNARKHKSYRTALKRHFAAYPETAMADKPNNVTPFRKDEMPTTDPKPALDPSRKATREERGKIRDELTRVYDIDQQRYAGSDSDKAVAERLDVPRAWVSTMRDEDFGDFDRNQSNQLKIAKLDDAIAMAKAATTKLIQMASDAETLERDLVAARKALED